ncbi:MAG TPA: amino acid adenylation domain-containing protein, partial [Isosphaeraceae bacterium]|nr:amino acid adenylation domain-containing protein [Isosphaeraceae bacterium]
MPTTSESNPAVDPRRARLARLVRERAARRRRVGRVLPLHRLFEARAAETPEAVALSCAGRSLSYRELNARANRLATRLRDLGVGPEVLVALCAERSVELIVGILGILKAGGAYVPLDPDYPADRIAYLIDDAKAPVLVTQPCLLDRLPDHAAEVVLLDESADSEPLADLPDLPGGASAGNLAYVIYTSGSTGRPKGVEVAHANVIKLFRATDRHYHFNNNDVWTLFHSCAFDFSVWELWGPLIHGGRLVVVPYWVSRSPERFLELLRDEGVTVLNQTPSAFRQLLRADEEAGAPVPLALRLVIFGGEALDPRTLRPWFDRRGDRMPQLVNMYGITETTVHVTYRALTMADLDAPGGASPIGRGIAGWRVLVLDEAMEPVPVGVAGELYVGGDGLAR